VRVDTSPIDSEAEACVACTDWLADAVACVGNWCRKSAVDCPLCEPLALVSALADKNPIDPLASPLKFHLPLSELELWLLSGLAPSFETTS
jgi:hypothetical protein